MSPLKDTITQVTGLSPKVQDEIFEQVKANRAKLDACAGPHAFLLCIPRGSCCPVATPTPQQRFGAKWRCTKCGGDVDGVYKIWYELGLKHGKLTNKP